tara:strand:- start:975 stop:1235 length:261 start_codon:yes stop_codon:yes gene_type:complete
MNNIEIIIKEQKEKSLAINNLVINLQYIQTLITQVFGANAESLDDYKNRCLALTNLCKEAEVSLREVKLMVPSPVSNDESLDVEGK